MPCHFYTRFLALFAQVLLRIANSKIDMQIDEAFADSQAPNAAAIKNARGVVIKKKLVGLFRSADGTLLFGDCKGSGAGLLARPRSLVRQHADSRRPR